MYRIIGGDDREYGPVSSAQVREWVAEGRANGATRAMGPDGEWRTLSDFDEFRDLLTAGAGSGSGAWVEEPRSGVGSGRTVDSPADAGSAPSGESALRPPGPGPSPAAPPPDEEFRRAPNLLAPAILCTICCCLPAGVVAIVKAAQANAFQAIGDRARARKAADDAHFWCWLAFAIGIVQTMLYILFLLKSDAWKS